MPAWHVAAASRIHPVPGVRWSVFWRRDDGDPWATSGACGTRLYFRFTRFADFLVDGPQITVAPRAFARPTTVRHLLLDQVLPLTLAAAGDVVLHAAAASDERGEAIVVCGAAGAGKSTLVAALAGCGWSVLADDGVLVTFDGTARAIPSYPGLRLWPDSAAATGHADVPHVPVAEYTRKLRVALRSAPASAARIRRIYVLEAGAGPDVERLEGQAAMLALIRHAYRPDVANRASLRVQLDHLQRLAGTVAVWRLRVPRDLPAIHLAARELAAHARRPAGEPMID